jgi:hypothetical protein
MGFEFGSWQIIIFGIKFDEVHIHRMIGVCQSFNQVDIIDLSMPITVGFPLGIELFSKTFSCKK